MNAELDRLRKEMTREEFIEYYGSDKSMKCPESFELERPAKHSCLCDGCIECYREAVKDIQFKDDIEVVKENPLSGMGKGAQIITNEHGGKQSNLPASFVLMDARAMFALGKVLKQGAETYERDNWRKITREEHIDHAMAHLFAHIGGDTQDDHLEHAFCRLMMALGVSE